MARKLGLLAIAAAVMAYAPMAAWGCSGSSAQLNDGTTVAQGYGSPTAQPMPQSSGSQSTGQSDTGSSSSDSSSSTEDK